MIPPASVMDDHPSYLAAVFAAHRELLDQVGKQLTPTILTAGELLSQTVQAGGKVLVCGNGGSAADSQHFAAELVGRFGRNGAPLPAMALTVDTSTLTAIGNDLGFAEVFSRQVEALGKGGDVLIVISTSGHSSNVLHAAERARTLDLRVVALTGADGLSTPELADVTIAIPCRDTQRIQEMHSLVLHVLGEMLVNDGD